ncbi:ribonuclease HI family protein [Paenarthrobacter sp. PH39-S1]|uniref:ribonuclease HI family protein n=1 Tax=Paenarthrobacter sp. PH39-S1 TaxID=3046204 RepID=UPI0024BBDD3B|nr:ribonuclease HI family protein [Paenarthrobacter sp. PH39-S1]MDJ0354553.1 ribonuclease HI family protein [Paenarthrobacter sp. PH39-S1]
MTIVAAADGSALGNPGPAGWAWYVDDSCWRAGGWPHGTNNQGELMAVLDLFRSTEDVPDEHLRILCDSQYVINCITKWMAGWKRKGWRKADGKPVLNVDLLKDIDAAIAGRDYSFEWVKGHAGHDLNEAADVRARAVAIAFQSGGAVPAGPGYPGSAAAAAELGATGADAVSGRRAVAHEDPDLFSSLLEGDFEPLTSSVRDQIITLEQELLRPDVRRDSSRVAVLLHPDFEEFGVSGRMWTRDAMLGAMGADIGPDPDMEVLDVALLDEATALMTYRTTGREGSALRSSLWRQTGGQWRLRFHQGTPEA